MHWPLQQVIALSGDSPQEAGHRLSARLELPEGVALRVTGAGFLVSATSEPLLDAAASSILALDPDAKPKKPQVNYIYGEQVSEPYTIIECGSPSGRYSRSLAI